MISAVTSSEGFLAALTTSTERTIRIKPRVIFELAEKNLTSPAEMKLPIPSSLLGSVTMLEAAILTTLLKLFEPRFIVEFGTFLGFSTNLLLKNSGEAKVLSIDLPAWISVSDDVQCYSDADLHSSDRMNDEYLRWVQATRGHPYLDGLTDADLQRLILIKADSKSVSVSTLEEHGRPDFTFIDGGHDRETVESDTMTTILAMGGSGVVVWHDFESAIHSDVTRFLLEWPEAPQLVAVESTLLAISFLGNSKSQLKKFAGE